MSRKKENTGFICENCGQKVMPLDNGSYRNHCPYCLYSKHIDKKPGDRAENCGGLMIPTRLKYKSGKGYQIIHRCIKCGVEKVNKIAEDTEQPDNIEILAGLIK
ncbi:MAG: RNHCP domain-containing protein [Dehalococcoidales bacterium]